MTRHWYYEIAIFMYYDLHKTNIKYVEQFKDDESKNVVTNSWNLLLTIIIYLDKIRENL